jgi:hypothetical protein
MSSTNYFIRGIATKIVNQVKVVKSDANPATNVLALMEPLKRLNIIAAG